MSYYLFYSKNNNNNNNNIGINVFNPRKIDSIIFDIE